MSCMTQVSMSS